MRRRRGPSMSTGVSAKAAHGRKIDHRGGLAAVAGGAPRVAAGRRRRAGPRRGRSPRMARDGDAGAAHSARAAGASRSSPRWRWRGWISLVAVARQPTRQLVARVGRRQGGGDAPGGARGDEFAVTPTMRSGRAPKGAAAMPAAMTARPTRRHRACHSVQPQPAQHHQRKGARRDRRQHRDRAPASPPPGARSSSSASTPAPISMSGPASSPSGIATSVASAAGITTRYDRHGDQVGENGQLLALVEVVDGERRHRGGGDERRQHDAAKNRTRASNAVVAPVRPQRVGGSTPS